MRANILKWTPTAIGVLLAQPAWAHDLKPGLYEIQVNMGTTSREETRSRCITQAVIERHDPFEIFSAFPQSNCLKLPMCFGNGKAGFDVVCVDGRPDKASARYRFSRERFTGTIELTREDNGRLVSLVETQRGRRIGPCTAEAD